jgi:hypothetical protein
MSRLTLLERVRAVPPWSWIAIAVSLLVLLVALIVYVLPMLAVLLGGRGGPI